MNPTDLNPRKLLQPDNIGETLLGWLIHAHKGRQRHDLAARRCDRTRLWVGAPAAVFSAIVGTSVFAALGKEASNTEFKATIAAISILSAILTGLATFLNLAERAEKHRSAGVQYKAVIRDLERLIGQITNGLAHVDLSVVAGIQKQLDELEKSAPIVPERIQDRVEGEYQKRGIKFVPKADDLYQSTSKS